jgi:glycosyltransferase involved in cell wall biosynthesis
MRVLLVTDFYAPLLGGANRATELLAKELAQRGYSVSVATSWQPGLPLHDEHAGIPVNRVRDLASRMRFLSSNPYQHVPAPWPDPEATLSLRRIVRGFRPDLVHAFGWMTYAAAAAVARTPIPLVMSVRDYGNVCALKTLVYKDGERCSGPALAKCLRCAGSFYGPLKGVAGVAGVLGGRRPLVRRLAAMHSMSHYVQSVMNDHLLRGAAPARLRANVVITDYGYLDDEGESPDPAFLAELPDEPYILYTGALRIVKGVYVLLDAYSRLAPRPPLVLLGMRTPDTPDAFPAGVHVYYDVPHPSVMAAWERALFGVFPSLLAEPLGIVVREAMSRGRPAIGTRPSGHEEMIADGATGFLVPPGDVDALAARMQQLIDDAPLRERMGAAARASVRASSVAEQVAAFEALYRKALGI